MNKKPVTKTFSTDSWKAIVTNPGIKGWTFKALSGKPTRRQVRRAIKRANKVAAKPAVKKILSKNK